MTVRLKPAGIQALQKRLARQAALPAARAAAGVLAEKLTGEGSGVKYANLPRRSSTALEYPAEQSGKTKESISARLSPDGLSAEFGSIDGPDYVAALHMKPPGDGGRPFMDHAYQDPDVRQAITQAFKDALK